MPEKFPGLAVVADEAVHFANAPRLRTRPDVRWVAFTDLENLVHEVQDGDFIAATDVQNFSSQASGGQRDQEPVRGRLR